jgi:hypothetical protein
VNQDAKAARGGPVFVIETLPLIQGFDLLLQGRGIEQNQLFSLGQYLSRPPGKFLKIRTWLDSTTYILHTLLLL